MRCFYGANVTDVLSGYFAWRADVILKMREHLQSDGFSIEMEMVSKMVKLDYSIYSVPITYKIREGETKLESIKDGVRIMFTFYRNLFWSPPQELFGQMKNDRPMTFTIETLEMDSNALVGANEARRT